MVRQYGMDSLWLAVAFAVGNALGYVIGWVELDTFRLEASNRGYFRLGQWVDPVDHERETRERRSLIDRDRPSPDCGQDVGRILQVDGVAQSQWD